MSYSRMTLAYMGRNFLKSMGLMLIPTLIFGIFIQPLSMLEVIVSIGRKEQTYNSFLEIFKKINGFDHMWKFVFLAIALLLALVIISLESGYNRQNMRYGSVSRGIWKNAWTYLNDNFLSVFKYSIVILISLEVVAILMSTFLYTTIKLFRNALPMCIIVALLFILLEIYFIAVTILAIPNMTMKGFGLFKAIGQSIYSLSAKSIKLFFSVLWVAALLVLPMIFLIIFPFNGVKYLLAVFSVLFYWIMISYSCALTYVVYFDVEELEREDLKV